MSDGGIGNGITFWATINIRGKMEGEELKDVMDQVRKVFADRKINGDVIHSLRLTADEEPVLSISMKESNTRKKRRRRKKNP